MAQKIWFITGASRGFGKEWAIAALERGDKVAAAVRSLDSVGDLVAQYGDAVLPIQLDVTDRPAVFDAVDKAHATFGQIDVVINNAGYGLLGAVEEFTESQIRDQFETNVFGTIWVLQAVLPVLRDQGRGHVLNVSSIGGVITLPYGGVYAASKWAIEGLTETLAQDVHDLGIRVTIIEPGAYGTGFQQSAAVAEPHPAYRQVKQQLTSFLSGSDSYDPANTRAAILTVVDAEAPPLRLILGPAYTTIASVYNHRLDEWARWEAVSLQAAGIDAGMAGPE